MFPVIAIIGRPNVGKSALFNRLVGRRMSIVDELEGVTRDRIYAEAECFGRKCILIDTGGIEWTNERPFVEEIRRQSMAALEEADAAILVVDGKIGPTVLDQEIANLLLRSQKPAWVAVNKIDNPDDQSLLPPFYKLGVQKIAPVSALQGNHVAELLETILISVPKSIEEQPQEKEGVIRIAIAGRPNVGKSTLLNALLGEDRSIVSPISGTTRDAVNAKLEANGQEYLVIDTAGIRRKKSEKEVVDKFASMRTYEAINQADVVLFMIDATQGLTIQERQIAKEIEDLGKSCVILFNKWDLTQGFRMEHAIRGLQLEVPFVAHCPMLCISAQSRRGIDAILPTAKKVYENRYQRIATQDLNRFLERCLKKYQPPMITGKRLKIYYATQTGVAPPRFSLFVNRPELVIDSYKQYLINQLRETYLFKGCPLWFALRGKKPYHTPS